MIQGIVSFQKALGGMHQPDVGDDAQKREQQIHPNLEIISLSRLLYSSFFFYFPINPEGQLKKFYY